MPKEQYFRLIADQPAEQASKKITGGIEIVPFAGEGVMSERPLLFTADGGRKLEQRNYAYWTDAPPQMLRDQLVTYLREAGVADSVAPSELRLESAYVVRGTIRRLEQLVGSSSGAVISLEFAVIGEQQRPAGPEQGLHRGETDLGRRHRQRSCGAQRRAWMRSSPPSPATSPPRISEAHYSSACDRVTSNG